MPDTGRGTDPVSKERSVRKMTVSGAAALLLAGLVASPGAAFAAPVPTGSESYLDGVQVCAAYDSGKVDVRGDREEVTVEAPEGQLISGYCVKAGSARQGEGKGGAYYVTLDEPAASVTITYPWGGGRAVSHYALAYTEPDEEQAPEPAVPDTAPATEPTEPDEEQAPEPAVPGTAPAGGTPAGEEPTDAAAEGPAGEADTAPADDATEDATDDVAAQAGAPATPAGDAEPTPAPVAEEPDALAATGASTVIGFTFIALALVGGGVTLIVLRRKGVLGS